MLEATNTFFNRAADCLGLSDRQRTILLTPNRVVRVEIITESDDGCLMHHLGFRVQHNSARGPNRLIVFLACRRLKSAISLQFQDFLFITVKI